MEHRYSSAALFAALAGSSLFVGTQTAMSQSTTMSASSDRSSVPADNTKSNKLDPSNSTATADMQKDNQSDRDLTQRIRKSLMEDKSLSTYAHNIKIVAVNGNVTLNGVVRSEQEKNVAESKAVEVAGQGRVVNDLKVSPKS